MPSAVFAVLLFCHSLGVSPMVHAAMPLRHIRRTAEALPLPSNLQSSSGNSDKSSDLQALADYYTKLSGTYVLQLKLRNSISENSLSEIYYNTSEAPGVPKPDCDGAFGNYLRKNDLGFSDFPDEDYDGVRAFKLGDCRNITTGALVGNAGRNNGSDYFATYTVNDTHIRRTMFEQKRGEYIYRNSTTVVDGCNEAARNDSAGLGAPQSSGPTAQAQNVTCHELYKEAATPFSAQPRIFLRLENVTVDGSQPKGLSVKTIHLLQVYRGLCSQNTTLRNLSRIVTEHTNGKSSSAETYEVDKCTMGGRDEIMQLNERDSQLVSLSLTSAPTYVRTLLANKGEIALMIHYRDSKCSMRDATEGSVRVVYLSKCHSEVGTGRVYVIDRSDLNVFRYHVKETPTTTTAATGTAIMGTTGSVVTSTASA